MKKKLVAAVLGIMLGLAGGASAVPIQCDPNNTGSPAYPNVFCDSTGRLLTDFGKRGTLTSGAGTIAAAGVSQTVFAANAARSYLIVQNISSANLSIAFGTAATPSNGILLIPNATFVMEGTLVTTQSVTIIGGTLGQAYVAWQGK